jgi:hypothetical protein
MGGQTHLLSSQQQPLIVSISILHLQDNIQHKPLTVSLLLVVGVSNGIQKASSSYSLSPSAYSTRRITYSTTNCKSLLVVTRVCRWTLHLQQAYHITMCNLRPTMLDSLISQDDIDHFGDHIKNRAHQPRPLVFPLITTHYPHNYPAACVFNEDKVKELDV